MNRWKSRETNLKKHSLNTKFNWKNLDFIIVDMPPGTGDTQLTFSQEIKMDGAIIISTPQEVALLDVKRGIKMFDKLGVKILGLVDNMSFFTGDDGKKYKIFGEGGVKKTAEEFEKNEIEPTQEDLDAYEDDELFYDAERGVGALEPRSRIRIRRTAYTDPDTNNVIPLAVPDQKVYGLDTGGFKEYVRNYIANIQKADLEKIFQTEVEGFQDGSTLLSIDNFERFGGSYEDNGMAVRDNLPMMFASALDIDPLKIIASGYLKYDKSLQNELESRADEEFGASIEDVERDVEVWAEQASRRQAWYFDVEVGEINGIPSIDEVGLVVYAILPEEVDVANNFSKINNIFT